MLSQITAKLIDEDVMPKTRLDRIKSFAVIGADLKDPGDGFKCIELDGIFSGTDGFVEAGVGLDAIPIGQPVIDDVVDATGESQRIIKAEKGNPCEQALLRHLLSYGRDQVNYLAVRLRMYHEFEYFFPPRFCEDSEDTGQLNDCDNLKMYYRYADKMGIIKGIEDVLIDKIETDRFFEGMRDFKPETLLYTKANLEYLKSQVVTRFIVKPRKGSLAEGIRVITERTKNLPKFNDPRCVIKSIDYVIEPFIKSKPIKCDSKGTYHDGCMRYAVIVEEGMDGKIRLFHYGGYWRLCRKPISQIPNKEAMIASYTQGSIPQAASPEDLRRAGAAMDKYISRFYRNVLKKIK